MSFASCYERSSVILSEGALGERLKREYDLPFDDTVALADIIYRQGGKEALCAIWGQYIETAKRYSLPFMARTPTRRANKERVSKAGHGEAIIVDNVRVLKQLQDRSDLEMYVGGLMGCRGDAYRATEILQPDEAEEFHSWQANVFTQTGVDFLYAALMPALSESIGMARAMERTGLPYIVGFMIRENGRLIDGTTVDDAISRIDSSVNRQPVCYSAGCVHPDIVRRALCHGFNQTSSVNQRFRGIQANASALAPEELDSSAELRCSDPMELAEAMRKLAEIMPLKIVGGCCGTNGNHLKEIAKIFRPIV